MRFSPTLLAVAMLAGCAKNGGLSQETRLAMTQAALDSELSDGPVVGPDDMPAEAAPTAAPMAQLADLGPDEPEVDLDAMSKKERRQYERAARKAERKAQKGKAPEADLVATVDRGQDDLAAFQAELQDAPSMEAEDSVSAAPMEPSEEPYVAIATPPEVSPSPVSPTRPTPPLGESGASATSGVGAVSSPTPPPMGSYEAPIPPSHTAPVVVSAPAPADNSALIAALSAQGSNARLTAAVESLAKSMDESRMQNLMEARLDDKQRLIDRLTSDVDQLRNAPHPAPVAPPPPNYGYGYAPPAPSAPARDDAALQRQLMEMERRQSEAMMAMQREMDAKDAAPSPELEALKAQMQRQEALLEQLVAQPKPAELEAEDDSDRRDRRDRDEDDEVRELRRQLERQEREMRDLRDRDRRGESRDMEREMRETQRELEDRLRALESVQGKDDGGASQRADEQPSPEVEALRAELASMRGQLADEQARREESTARIDALQTALDRPTEDETTEDLRARIDELESDRGRVSALQGDMDALRAERDRLEAEAQQADEARQAELEAERQANADRTAELQAELERLRSRTSEMERLYTEQYASVLAQLQPLIDSGLDVRVVAGKIRLQLPSDVLFSSGSASLARKGNEEVVEVAAALGPFKSLLVQVEGHTDNVPVKSFKYDSNWDLAFARAKAVMQVLVDGGLDTKRVSAASYGDTRPVASNEDREGRSKNRRIEMVLQLESDRGPQESNQP